MTYYAVRSGPLGPAAVVKESPGVYDVVCHAIDYTTAQAIASALNGA